MSFTGDAVMALLRLIKPGKGSFADLKKSQKRAEKENARGGFTMPKDRKSLYELAPDTEYPCLIIRSRKRKEANGDKAILFFYGGATRQWRSQIGIARGYADRTGLPVWFPIYPAVTEANITKSIDALYGVYRRMTGQYDAEKITVVGLSFGGTFALELVNWNNRAKKPVGMPGLIIVHSPGGIPDTEEDWAELKKYEPRDPIFTVSDIRAIIELMPEAESTPPHALTPIREDFHAAPETYLYYGEEVLAGNAPAYRRAFERDGAGERLHIEIVKNMMHGYSCMPVFPESKRAYYETIRLIEEL